MKMGQTTIWIVIVVVAILVIGGFYYFSSGTPSQTQVPSREETNTTGNEQQQEKAPEGVDISVSINDFVFSLDDLTVNVGDRVIWTNDDSISHTVAADNAAFVSRPLKPGETFAFVFNKAGTYKYGCTIHPNMRATVTVR